MPESPVTWPMQPPPPGEAVLPLPRNMSLLNWGTRLFVWAILIACFFLLLRYDVALMEWRYRHIPNEVEGWSKQILLGFRDFGQVLPIVVSIIVIFKYDRRRKFVIAAILLAQALASAAYNANKYTIARYRPYAAVDVLRDASGAADGQAWEVLKSVHVDETWLGIDARLREERTRSFPSGHSAAAFAFAGVMVWFYPRIRRTLWVLATGCALSRYLDAVHWPSDCMAGAVIGYAGAWLALRPYAWVLPVIWYRRRAKRRGAARRASASPQAQRR